MFFSWFKKLFVSEPSGVRAKDKKGRFVADDPNTPDVNEAWVGGKAPKKRKKVYNELFISSIIEKI